MVTKEVLNAVMMKLKATNMKMFVAVIENNLYILNILK
jgi:predicted nucleic acid-binding Zn finger protein